MDVKALDIYVREPKPSNYQVPSSKAKEAHMSWQILLSINFLNWGERACIISLAAKSACVSLSELLNFFCPAELMFGLDSFAGNAIS